MIVPKFHYSVRKAFNKEKNVVHQTGHRSSKLLDDLQKALDVETVQNDTEFKRLLVSTVAPLRAPPMSCLALSGLMSDVISWFLACAHHPLPFLSPALSLSRSPHARTLARPRLLEEPSDMTVYVCAYVSRTQASTLGTKSHGMVISRDLNTCTLCVCINTHILRIVWMQICVSRLSVCLFVCARVHIYSYPVASAPSSESPKHESVHLCMHACMHACVQTYIQPTHLQACGGEACEYMDVHAF
jgi:hypothetical protein